MRRFARVEDGIVCEIIDADDLPPFHPDVAPQFREAPASVQEGWSFDGSTFTAPPGPSLVDLKSARCAAVNTLRDAKIAEGVVFSGFRVEMRTEDQISMIGAVSAAHLALDGAVPWDAGFAWIAANNSTVPLPQPADMIALGHACMQHKRAMVFAARAHKDAILVLRSAEAVVAYDITTGW